MNTSTLKTVVIFNPASGGGKAEKKFKKHLKRLKSLLPSLEIETTQHPGHAIDIIHSLPSDVNLIISAGGDGTLNECVNGILKAKHPAMLASLPIGTGNDLPVPNRMPSTPTELFEALTNPRSHHVDVGHVKEYDRFFLGVASMGFDAEVTYKANSGSKRLPGTWNYFIAIFKTLRKFKPKVVEIKLHGEPSLLREDGTIQKQLDDGEVLLNHGIMLMAIGNGTRYGGGMLVCPHASTEDGFLDLTFVKPASKRTLMRVLPKVYKGTHVKHPLVGTARAKKIEVQSNEDVRLQVDGEVIGFLPETFECKPKALKVLSAPKY